MAIYKFIIYNQDPICGSKYEQNINTSGCTTFLLRLNNLSTSEGPFNICIDTINSTPIYTNITRNQLSAGVQYSLECPTPTPSPTPQYSICVTRTPTITPSVTITSGFIPTPSPTPSITRSVTPTMTMTPSITRTITPTPSITPSITRTITPTPSITRTITPTNTPSITPSNLPFYAYVFAEPQTYNNGLDLENYMLNNNSTWGGYQFYGVPSTIDYSNNLNTYAHYSGWTSNSNNYITSPTNMSSIIKQSSGTSVDSFGCTQTQYSFGTIQITESDVNPNIQYFYTIWIPIAGVGNNLNSMIIDAGTSLCGNEYLNNGIPDDIILQNVTITSGAAIPPGNYRVLWLPILYLPITIPLYNNIYIKGEIKY